MPISMQALDGTRQQPLSFALSAPRRKPKVSDQGRVILSERSCLISTFMAVVIVIGVVSRFLTVFNPISDLA